MKGGKSVDLRKRIVRLIYVIVGAAIGFYYLPLVWDIVGLHLNNALLVFIDLFIGAIIFWLLSLLLAGPTIRLITRN